MKPDPRTLWKMFIIFFRIGAFTIGGGYAMLPLIEREVVDNQKWVTREEIVDVFAVSQSVPGVIAINSSMFIGYKVAGFTGLVTAALGVILPSFLTILGIAYLLFNISNNIYLEKAFTGVRAGVTGMIALSAIKLGKKAVSGKLGKIIAVSSFIGVVVLDINAMWVILAGGIVGLLFFGFRSAKIG